MPLYFDPTSSTQIAVDLSRCTFGDGGFGSQPSPGSNYQVCSYAQSIAGFAPTRMSAIINDSNNVNFYKIILISVPPGSVLPDGSLIDNEAGETNAPDANGNIVIYYDSTPNRYFCYGAAGNQICFPSHVLVFHELAHAFHLENGDFDDANPEVQAETDENQFRSQLLTPLRDPNNHNGGVGMVLC
jgi:hypothetical protein